MSKFKMFATENKSDKWLVAIDGHYQLFGSKSEAESLYNAVGQISESAFGSAQIMAPKEKALMFDGREFPKSDMGKQIDLVNYVKIKPTRRFEKNLPSRNTAQRLSDKKCSFINFLEA